MRSLCATTASLLLLGSFVLAQGVGSIGGAGSPGGTPGSTTPGAAARDNATVPPGTTLPGGTPAPSDGSTVGRGPGVNPSNPQDLLGRSNPQDLSGPRGRNPQDAGTGNPPPITLPEK